MAVNGYRGRVVCHILPARRARWQSTPDGLLRHIFAVSSHHSLTGVTAADTDPAVTRRARPLPAEKLSACSSTRARFLCGRSGGKPLNLFSCAIDLCAKGGLQGMGIASMQADLDVEECYRRAIEARRIAKTPGVTAAEKADLLEVERRWLSLARGDQARRPASPR
jgi:hypothetical protein